MFEGKKLSLLQLELNGKQLFYATDLVTLVSNIKHLQLCDELLLSLIVSSAIKQF